ncbi:MAG TPA: metal-dependent hydrolase [Polyangiales bacterium]|nr:metal-dependent hydrolase [Polyangiales bacterium]
MLSEVRTAAQSRTIAPRNLELDIPTETPLRWFGGNAYYSHLLNAFSLMFPPGERFFMDSVRTFRDRIRTPALREQVRGFLGQEALHSREHRAFNRFLTSKGIDADGIESAIWQEILQRKATREPLDDLAVTCALEHFTALMAEMWLHEPELRALVPEPLRKLWTWHAIEELDHKSVAFDVYQEVGGDHARRMRWMRRITIGFIVGVSFLHIDLMRADKAFDDPLMIARSWWKFWGPRGFYTKRIPQYLSYYKPDFHPWEEDSRALIERFERELYAS